jgi:teichoic acid transport system ATP-binding protein
VGDRTPEVVAGSRVESAPAARTPVIVVRDLHVTYRVHEEGGRRGLKEVIARGLRPAPVREVAAVQGVSFEVCEGEAVGLIGRNGSGKSTMLRAVAGLLPFASGQVLAKSEPVLLGVGAALNPHMSGRRNIYLGGTALGITRREVDARFDAIVEFSGVGEFIEMPVRAYSSGMAARLKFAIATALYPDILFIDEALNVGDEEFRRRSQTRIDALLDQAGAVMLVSHSLSTVTAMCTRVLWLDEGRIRLDGPAHDVVHAYQQFTRGLRQPT